MRGYLTGFVTAFDKFWNISLEDVYEKWTRARRRKYPALGKIKLTISNKNGTKLPFKRILNIHTIIVRILINWLIMTIQISIPRMFLFNLFKLDSKFFYVRSASNNKNRVASSKKRWTKLVLITSRYYIGRARIFIDTYLIELQCFMVCDLEYGSEVHLHII